MSSLVSANGPSVTYTLPSLKPTRAPFDVAWRPAPSTMTPASMSCWLYLPIVSRSFSDGSSPASVLLSAFTIIMNRTVNLLSPDGRTGSVEIDRSAESGGCRSGRPPFDQAIEGDITMRTNKLLWIVQGLLAALFLFAGGVKLVLPVEAMQQGPVALPGPFLRFIGVAEVCGALGLVLPWALRIRPRLTPLAACRLIVIMIWATVIT